MKLLIVQEKKAHYPNQVPTMLANGYEFSLEGTMRRFSVQVVDAIAAFEIEDEKETAP